MTATATAPTTGERAGRNGGPRSPLAGTGTLIRFSLRRDRVRLPVWIGASLLATVGSVTSFEATYPEPEDIESAKATFEAPAGLAMSGPDHYLSGEYHYGAMTGHQMISFMALVIGIMSILTVVRHTRAEEETGRAELLRSHVIGRHAHLAAALVVAVAANVVLGALLAAGLGSLGVDGVTAGGSLLYGATSVGIGLVFTAVAAVTVQITPFARGSSGMAIAALGVAYALRAVGDVGADAFSWLSPIGWAQRTYVYVDNRWWPLLLNVALAAVCVALAVFLSTRRDVGAGLRPPRPGRPGATDRLAHPVAFALRLHRGVLVAFGFGALLMGVAFGSLLGETDDVLDSSDEFRETVEELGGSLEEAFASVVLAILVLIAICYAVMTVLRARAEETGGRAEPLLATGLSRTRWLGSHLVVALAGGSLISVLGGLGFGLAGAGPADDSGLIWSLTWAAAAYAPAVWVTAGIALVFVGWFPGASAAAWAAPAYMFFTVYLGQLMDTPDFLLNLSPLSHIPQVPAEDLEWTPLLILTALAAGLVALGLAGFRRRDLDLK
ncbi:ABC transporter permease [Streptomyces sp. PT12]|uniref:ABC transporter permease n=1 Tax=Streptomyces sp. PT12 TaxID=1510197 RepID=UPI000DE4372B|nr:ABC transporter permease [Streptomyces sp. PT12]RBM14917.1 ABC transporter permease [Streptomyces sp. PT12]